MAIRSYDWRRQSRPKGAVDCYADACAYPFTLFDKRTLASEPGWQPQVVVIALGTNDFTTPLNPGERWATRDVLHADFETTYVRFIKRLRARNPNALIVIWATDIAKGEIQMEAAKVAATLRASGDTLVDYVPVNGLSFTGCHAYPSLIDEAVIAGRIAAAIDSHSDVWSVGRPRPAY